MVCLAASACAAPASFETLHPALWRASQVGRPRETVFASGFAALDAVLPGGGWPAGVLTELLLPHPGVGEMRLVAPVLARLQRQLHERCLMWFDPPAQPCAWALGALGLSARQLVLVRSSSAMPAGPAALAIPARPAALAIPAAPAAPRAPAGRLRAAAVPAHAAASLLWALEHALKSGHVGAVLAWLPGRLPADALRRLQLAAQAHEGPVFVLRGDEVARQASPAPLRLVLSAAAPDWLRVHVLKRRGPPLGQPLLLELPPVLAAPAAGRARAGSAVPGAAVVDRVEAARAGLLPGSRATNALNALGSL
ncbi:MAG: hypothetical protein JNJ89_07575 [Rubrivivax sp.]|nr:hypothetical protein [Rubrivivax sp.]